MACNANVWVFIENCGAGLKCTVTPSTDGKGTPSACVSSTVGVDASGDGAPSNSDVGAGTDAAEATDVLAGTDAMNVDLAPDVYDAGGCVNGTPCDDGDGCTVGDKCLKGSCVGSPKSCDDGDSCTVDACQDGACAHTPGDCADGSSLDKALPLTLGTETKDSLAATGTSRWFKFDGSGNAFVFLATQTAQIAGQYDDTIIDTMLTIYGPDQQQLAFNDDGLNFGSTDSGLWTKLSQSGTYYVEVQECWTWLEAHPSSPVVCGGVADKNDTSFSLIVVDQSVSPLTGAVEEVESNSTISSATPLAFVAQSAGVYFQEELLGSLSSGPDVDYYAFTVPDDLKFSQGRLTASVSFQPGGVGGDGSPLTALKATVYDADTNLVLGRLNLNGNDLRVPVQAAASGKSYALRLEHDGGAFTSFDWYAVELSLGGSNPVETNESGNNVQSGAQNLVAGSSSTSAVDYFVGGDIIGGGTDVDWFVVSVPSGMKKFTVSCGSKFMGSGVVSFKAQVMSASGADLSAGGLAENTSALLIKNLSVPSGATKLYLKLTATGQDATNMGTFYECGLHLSASALP